MTAVYQISVRTGSLAPCRTLPVQSRSCPSTCTAHVMIPAPVAAPTHATVPACLWQCRRCNHHEAIQTHLDKKGSPPKVGASKVLILDSDPRGTKTGRKKTCDTWSRQELSEHRADSTHRPFAVRPLRRTFGGKPRPLLLPFQSRLGRPQPLAQMQRPFDHLRTCCT
jgi:hypothetical protein